MQQDLDARILFLFRHGETDWNREGRLQGHTDTALNATGHNESAVSSNAAEIPNQKCEPWMSPPSGAALQANR